MQEYGTLIRTDAAMNLLARYKDDLVMDQLLNYANYVVIGRFQSDTRAELPVADFDLFFYLETVERFCRDRRWLRAVLAKAPFSINKRAMVSLMNRRAEQTIGLIRGQEAIHLLGAIEERTTLNLMERVTSIALQHWGSSRQPLAEPFDFYFFMRAMQTFCGDHLFLTKVLNGEDLRWFSVA